MLKRVLILLCAAIIVATAVGAKKAHANPVCDALRFYAYEVMKERQMGTPKRAVINDTYIGYKGTSPNPIMFEVIEGAYGTPIYQNNDIKHLAAQTYAENWHYECVNHGSNK